MTTLSLPELLVRHTIGLESLPRLMESASQTNYPPYNIEQVGEDSYALTIAVAGFAEDEINIVLLNRALTIEGQKTKPTTERTFLHRGISFRDFSRQFTLGDHIEVSNVRLDNGLLTIHLERRLPESAKPKRIAIERIQ